jgi:hypothetical protein
MKKIIACAVVAASLSTLSSTSVASLYSPFGNANLGGGFGIQTPIGGANLLGFGLNSPFGNANLGGGFGIQTPIGGANLLGFGLNSPFGNANLGGGFGIQTPIGGANILGFGLQGQGQSQQQTGGVHCGFGHNLLLASSVTSCESAGGKVRAAQARHSQNASPIILMQTPNGLVRIR